MKHFLSYQGPVIAWSALIFILSSQSTLPSLPIDDWDKLAHAVVFGTLGIAAHRAVRGQRAWRWGHDHAIGMSLMFVVFYGAIDEFHQRYVPGRTPDLADLAADSVGAIIALIGLSWWLSRQRTVPD